VAIGDYGERALKKPTTTGEKKRKVRGATESQHSQAKEPVAGGNWRNGKKRKLCRFVVAQNNTGVGCHLKVNIKEIHQSVKQFNKKKTSAEKASKKKQRRL